MVTKCLLYTVLSVQTLSSVAPVFGSGSGDRLPSFEDADSASPQAARAFASLTEAEWQELADSWRKDLSTPLQERCLEVAQDEHSPFQWEAIRLLWRAWNRQRIQTRATLYPLVRRIAQDDTHPHQLEAIESLWSSCDNQQAKNREVLHAVLIRCAQNVAAPQLWNFIFQLWDPISEDRTASCLFLRPLLLKAAQDPQHVGQWEAMNRLLYEEGEQETQNRHFLRPALLAIAQNPDHKHQWDALHQLWYPNGGANAEDRLAALPMILEILQQDEHPHQWDAFLLLRHLQYKNKNPQLTHALRSLLVRFAQTPVHAKQQDAIRMLRESTNSKDQSLGRFFELAYFPKFEPPTQVIDLRGETPEMLLGLFNLLITPGKIPLLFLPYILPDFRPMKGLADEGMLVCQTLAWLQSVPADVEANGVDHIPLPVLMTQAVVLEDTRLRQRLEAARLE